MSANARPGRENCQSPPPRDLAQYSGYRRAMTKDISATSGRGRDAEVLLNNRNVINELKTFELWMSKFDAENEQATLMPAPVPWRRNLRASSSVGQDFTALLTAPGTV